MKKIILTTLILGASLTAAAQIVPSNCVSTGRTGVCFFPINQGNKDQIAEFYCTTDTDVTQVNFANHNVLISGFNADGTLTFGQSGKYPVTTLNKVYFEVKNDLNHDGTPKTVTFKAQGGKIECHNTRGGRNTKLPGWGGSQ